jgi:NlpC/P60 family putative phage cell wall peptidase
MPTRQDVVDEARSWIGTPYVHQQSLKGAGCDCVGLLCGVWNRFTGEVVRPHVPYRPDWAESGTGEVFLETVRSMFLEMKEAAPGDVMMFRIGEHSAVKHCAIVVEPGKMVHAYSGHGVVESHIGAGWANRCVATFRFPWIAD